MSADAQRARLEYLTKLYNLSRGDGRRVFDKYQIGDKLGIGHEQVDIITQYLSEERLIAHKTIDLVRYSVDEESNIPKLRDEYDDFDVSRIYHQQLSRGEQYEYNLMQVRRLVLRERGIPFEICMISITHKGIKAIEQALKHPDKPTKYFSRPSFILNITGGMFNNSPFQVASRNSTQNLTIAPNDLAEIKRLLTELKEVQNNANLQKETKEELEANMRILRIQSQAETHKRERITGALTSIKSILEESSEIISTAAPTS